MAFAIVVLSCLATSQALEDGLNRPTINIETAGDLTVIGFGYSE